MKITCAIVAAVVIAMSAAVGTADACTDRQVKTLKRELRYTKSRNGLLQRRNTALRTQLSDLRTALVSSRSDYEKLKTERDRLSRELAFAQGEVTTLTGQRDAWIAEAGRLRGLIVNEVHALANSWRNDGNPKTDVSYYQGDNYWSYSFAYCGFC